MLECQICGHRACDHIADMVQEHVDSVIKLQGILEKAARVVGKEITGKELKEEHVRNIVEMIRREENMITWMTLDERTAMELDIAIREDRILSLIHI